MSVSFAGSRSLDERRRRRLAVENDEPTSPRRRGKRGRGSGKTDGRATAKEARCPSHLPLRRIISPRIWKIWAIGLTGLVAVAAIVFLSLRAESLAAACGPEVAGLFDPREGPVLQAAGVLCWALSAQLSLLIWWGRSRSPNDFDGRYRIWFWAAAAQCAAALTAATAAHLAWCSAVSRRWNVEFWNYEALLWLAPAAGCGCVLLRDVRRELGSSRSAAVTFSLALLLWGGAAAETLGARFAASPAASALMGRGLFVLGSLAFFQSLLLYARHVFHVSCDPPRRRRGFRLRIPRPRLRLRGLKLPRPRIPLPLLGARRASADPAEAPAASPAERARESAVKQAAVKTPDGATKPPVGSEAAASQRDEPRTVNDRRSLDEQSLAGASLDHQSSRSLSKRERRRLRKQRRRQKQAA